LKILGLKEFEQAFDEFEKNGWGVHYDCHFKAEKRHNDFNLQIRAQVLAEDIGFTCMIFKDYYLESINEILKNGINVPRKIPMCQLKAANVLKHIFFSIRAYHDALYKVLLRIFDQKINAGSSMKRTIEEETEDFKTGNPVGRFLKDSFPEYAKWFLEFREWRNEIKNGQGVNFSVSQDFIDQKIEMRVGMVNRLNNKRIDVGLGTLENALNVSLELTRLVIALGIKEQLFTSVKT